MSACALTIPVLGESSAPRDGTWGSRARASSAVSRVISTPLAWPSRNSSSSLGSSPSFMAVMSLPTRAWGTPWRAQSS